MSIEGRTIAALKWTAAAKFASQLGSWAVTLVVIRLLSPADYGLMAMITIVFSLASAVAEFGLSAAIVQQRSLSPEILRRIVGLLYVLHFGLAFAIVIAADGLSRFFGEPQLVRPMQAAALQLMLAALGAAPHAIALREMGFRWIATVELWSALIASVATLALAWTDFGVWALVGGALSGTASRTALLMTRGPNIIPSFRMTGIREHLSYGSKSAASGILWSALTQMDALIGARLLTRDGLGAYSVALSLALMPMNKILSIINQVAFSAIARLQDDHDRLRLRLLQSIRLMLAVGVPVAWGLSSVASELVTLLIGDKWGIAIVPLQLVCIVVPMRMLTALIGTAVAAVGRADINLRNSVTAFIVWPACFYLGAQAGPDGLAGSWLVAVPLSFIINFSRNDAVLGLGKARLARFLFPPVLAGVIMAGVVFFARTLIPELPPIARLLLLMMTGAVVYMVTLAATAPALMSDVRRLLSGEHAPGAADTPR